MDLPFFENDITNNLRSQKPVKQIHGI